MRRWWILVGLLGCRQVFGIDQPAPIADGRNSTTDGHTDGHGQDALAFAPGLAMYVMADIALWTDDQPPDQAWAETDPAFAAADLWTGSGPSEPVLAADGVLSGHPFSVWMEGQVYAPQGTQEVQVQANDYAFFDAELSPNSGSFEHVVTCKNDMTQMRTITVPIGGWYRVRVGWSSAGNAPVFSVLHAGAGDPSVAAYDGMNLRH